MSCIIPENLPKVTSSIFICRKSLFGFKGGFTGKKKDKLGRENCYSQGKKVSCNQGGLEQQGSEQSGRSNSPKSPKVKKTKLGRSSVAKKDTVRDNQKLVVNKSSKSSPIAGRLLKDKNSIKVIRQLTSEEIFAKTMEIGNKRDNLFNEAKALLVGLEEKGDDELIDRYNGLVNDYEEVTKEYNQANDEIRKKLVEKLAVKKSHNIEIYVSKKMSDDLRNNIDSGIDFLSKVFAKSNSSESIQPVNFFKAKVGSRSSYERKYTQVNLVDKSDVSTVVHETCHHLEDEIPGVRESIHEFLEYRTKGHEREQLNKVFPDLGYNDDEIGCKDNFDKAFSNTQAYYIGKIYADGATEVLSMGMEKLYQDPFGLISKDPEFAQFLIGVLSGRIRGKSK